MDNHILDVVDFFELQEKESFLEDEYDDFYGTQGMRIKNLFDWEDRINTFRDNEWQSVLDEEW